VNDANKKNSVRMLLRRYVMELIYQNPGAEIKLPSNEDLAKKFNMARCTAQVEMKILIEEGFIKAKPGIGTFTVPDRIFATDEPLVGLIHGDGKLIYLKYSGWAQKSYVGLALATLPAALEEITIYSSTPRDTGQELLNLACSAFIWLDPSEKYDGIIRKLAEERIVITGGRLLPGISGVLLDTEDFGRQIARELLRQNRTRLLYLNGYDCKPCYNHGIRSVFAEAGVNYPKNHYIATLDGHQRIETILATGFRPQAVFFRHEEGEYLVQLLTRHGIDLTEECRMVSVMYKPRSLNAPMLIPELPLTQYGTAFKNELIHRLETPTAIPQHHIINPELEMKLC